MIYFLKQCPHVTNQYLFIGFGDIKSIFKDLYIFLTHFFQFYIWMSVYKDKLET